MESNSKIKQTHKNMNNKTVPVSAYILHGVGFAASIAGVFYAHKKGYGGWGKVGMFILFGAPFNIAGTAITLAASKKDEKNG